MLAVVRRNIDSKIIQHSYKLDITYTRNLLAILKYILLYVQGVLFFNIWWT